MKKFYYLSLACVLALAGCSKEEAPGFDYDVNLLHGTWRITHVMQSDGTYFNVTTTIAEDVFEPTYAAFISDGTYVGKGEFGDGSGTYKAIGKTIITYIGGDEYLRYNVLSLSGATSELEMYEKDTPSEALKIKVTKISDDNSINFKIPYSPDH